MQVEHEHRLHVAPLISGFKRIDWAKLLAVRQRFHNGNVMSQGVEPSKLFRNLLKFLFFNLK